MIDLDRAGLDRILPSTRGSADWDDVLSRSGVQRRRRRLLVALAATAVLAAATASAFGMRALLLDKGFIGLPPEGATPSTPDSGELEIFYWVADPNGTLGRSRAWVYADGRLIWLREGSDLPESANPLSTGFLEQRLTPEGVELLRSEIASSGEFGDEVPPPPSKPPCAKGASPADNDCVLPTPPPAPDEPLTVPFYTTIEVADLGRLVHVDRASDLERLEARLSDPASWLPENAWADRDIRAYVSSKYAVCYGGWPPDHQVERSRVLALLPPAARDLLGGDTPLRQGPLFGEPGNYRPSYEYCSDMSTEDARAIAVALDDAGLQRQGAFRLNYRLEARGTGPETRAFIYFEPYLPHGEITCSACG